MRLALLVVVMIVVSAGLVAQTQDGQPSYEDTVRYLQERLSHYRQFTEVGRCEFAVTEHSSEVFHLEVNHLTPHINWKEQGWDGFRMCKANRNCVRTLDDTAGGAQWYFWLNDPAERPHVEKALTHLLDLCGVPPEDPNMF